MRQPESETIPSPKLTSHERIARDVLDAIKAMMEAVPKLQEKERRSKAFVRTHMGIPQKFIDTTVSVIELTPELDRMEQMNLAAAYSSAHLGKAFRPVVWELARTTEELLLLLDTRQANVAAEALNVYGIAKRWSVTKRAVIPTKSRAARSRKCSAPSAVAGRARNKRAPPVQRKESLAPARGGP